jgi:dipeptidyl aminopeptidase/acylaminoacyl peptidase
MLKHACVLWCALAAVAAAQPSNDPDVYLASLAMRGGTVTVGAPVNISNSPGYDNQPSFTPDGRALLFTSGRGAGPAPSAAPEGRGQAAAPPTDIYRYDIETKAITRLTNTPESEYSPTVMPDGAHISVIRVEADKTQRLWKFNMDGSNPSLVLTDIKPVGYHAWIDAYTLALFVLGQDRQPASLQVADVRTGKAETVAQGIGRSVLRTPSGDISFVRQVRSAPDVPPTYTIEQVAKSGGAAPAVLIAPVPGSGDPNLAWAPDGTLLMAHDGALYSWRKGDSTWTRAADLAALGLNGVTRLAVSPRGDRIAIVAVPR